MSVVATCRVLNEERNIERFCKYYSEIADRILIADGGSEDRTVELAQAFPKVSVRLFDRYVERGGVRRNPHGEHINFLIYWAIAEGADWIIFDDCDSIPNAAMREAIPFVFEMSDIKTVRVRRLYLYKDEGYFHDMSFAGYARWAWRVDVNIRADESDPWVHHMLIRDEFEDGDEYLLNPPSCLLHFSFPDDEEIQRKADFYRVAKEMPDHQIWHPTKFGGEIKPLPDFATL